MLSASAVRPCCSSQRGDFRQIPADPPNNGGADRADDHDPAPAVESEDGLRHQLPGQERHHRHRGEHDELVIGEGRPALFLRHQFGHIGIDVHQFDAEPDAGNEPPQIDALRRVLKRHDEGADRIPKEREGEDRTAAVPVGQPAERERADEQAQEQRGHETGKALEIEQSLRRRREYAGLEQADGDIGGEEQIVEFEPAAERQ